MSMSNNSNINTNINIKDEDLYLYVLNENNKYITKQHIEKVLKRYGISHKVKNLQRFQQAMTHSSYVERDLKNDRIVKIIKEKNIQPIDDPKKAIPLQKDSYERLEFLGDSIIHCILAEYLFNRYEDEQEGFMTRLRTKIENGETLSELANILGFHEYAIIARNIEQIGGRDKNFNIFEDCFEAFIGALYLESDFDTCKKFIVSLIQKEVDIPQLLYKENNFKDLLLQYYHKMKWEDPEYGLEETIGPDENGKKIFKMYVKGYTRDEDDEIVWTKIGRGSGSSKKKGEQEAARQSLLYYEVINENSDDEGDEYEEIND
jgi:dsRNA-specific ribonuclease